MAKLAIERKTGARGLRGIMEGILSGLMFQVPSDPSIIRVVIGADGVEDPEKIKIYHK